MAERTTQAAPGELEAERARRCLAALVFVLMQEHGPRVARNYTQRAEMLTGESIWPREPDGTSRLGAEALAGDMILGKAHHDDDNDPADHRYEGGCMEVEDPDEA